MNWIQRLHEIKGKDQYSQNGEGLILEYIFDRIGTYDKRFVDIGGGDGFYLSNTRHLGNLGWEGIVLDRENGIDITVENVLEHIPQPFDLLSIDIDGNDYWVIQKILTEYKPRVIIAEFNPAFHNARTIKYNPNHSWDGDDYYGFTYKAGVKIAEENGYKVIFQVGDMNLIMVNRNLLGNNIIPDINYSHNNFFARSERTDWETWI
jgi:hypothetical protein